jgi:hypothetical protein
MFRHPKLEQKTELFSGKLDAISTIGFAEARLGEKGKADYQSW